MQYCQKEKGLELYSWVLMSNHMHLIVKAKEGYQLSAIIRDFKKFTSKQIIKSVQEEPESKKRMVAEHHVRIRKAKQQKTNLSTLEK